MIVRRLRPLGALLAALALVLATLGTAGAAPGAAGADEPSATIGAEFARALAIADDGEQLDVIVSFWDESGLQRFEALEVPTAPFAVMPMSAALLTPAEIAEVASWPETRGVHENVELQTHNHQSVGHTGAHEVWEQGITGADVGVAVVDTGIDGTHPDLRWPDKTVQNVKIAHTRQFYWAHPGDTDTVVHYEEDLPHTDTYGVGHGTHVAGTAAGAGEADEAYKGMAPGADVIGIGAGDGLFIYQAAAGLEWLLIEDDDGVANHERYDVRVVNNSWGTTNGYELDVDHPINQITHELYRAGMVVVFSAGNSGDQPDTVNFYTLPPWIVGIGATNKIGMALTGFSSRGYPNHPFKTVDVSAPGDNIESAMFYAWAANPYWGLSGTSMSAPHVSGLVALLAEANPELSPDQIAEIIRDTADGERIADGTARWEQGAGFIDVLAAYEAAVATDGQREAFLAGQAIAYPDAGQVAEEAPLPYERDDEVWTGTIGPSLVGVGDTETHTFTVDERAEFLTVRLDWDGTTQTLGMTLTDPDGEEHATPVDAVGLALGSGRILRIPDPPAGEWTAEVSGDISVLTDYTGEIAQYLMHLDEDGEPVSNW